MDENIGCVKARERGGEKSCAEHSPRVILVVGGVGVELGGAKGKGKGKGGEGARAHRWWRGLHG